MQVVVTLVCVQLKHVLGQRKAELTASCERLLACTHCCHEEETGLYCSLLLPLQRFCPVAFRRGSVVERRSLAGELSLSCARPAADG